MNKKKACLPPISSCALFSAKTVDSNEENRFSHERENKGNRLKCNGNKRYYNNKGQLVRICSFFEPHETVFCRLLITHHLHMIDKEALIFGRQFDCAECTYKERPIVIVGSNEFSTDILAQYIRSNKPALTSVVKRLGDIPHTGKPKYSEWRLIFIDCHSLDGDAIMEMLQTEGAPFLQQDIIALFNLSKGNADISAFIDLGVRGFFFESDQPDVLLKGICALKYGEMWVARGVLMEYICHKPKQVLSPKDADAVRRLTRREKDILIHLSSGATNEDIASRLFISLHTVKTHIYNILKKLNVQNRLQAALWAAKYLK